MSTVKTNKLSTPDSTYEVPVSEIAKKADVEAVRLELDTLGAEVYATMGKFIAVSGDITAEPNKSYWLDGSHVLTLPANVSVCDQVTVTKALGSTPTIQTQNSVQIHSASGEVDTSVIFDVDAELVFIFNGTNWEI